MINFWEKKKSIQIRGKFATSMATIAVLTISIFLLYCAVNPPTYFPFLKDGINRIIYGVMGVFFIFKALRMFFVKKHK